MPTGFAHGFYTLSQLTEVLCKTIHCYAPEREHTLVFSDLTLGISWLLVDNLPSKLSDISKHMVEFIQP